MKSILVVFFIFSGFQQLSAQSTPAEQVAQKIAQRLQDSLHLTSGQKELIYQLNMELHDKKMAVRLRHSDPAVLQYEIQKVENTRDSLYKEALGAELFVQYQARKQSLINNN